MINAGVSEATSEGDLASTCLPTAWSKLSRLGLDGDWQKKIASSGGEGNCLIVSADRAPRQRRRRSARAARRPSRPPRLEVTWQGACCRAARATSDVPERLRERSEAGGGVRA